jgi:ABC-2 type transport system ATP-binding protein
VPVSAGVLAPLLHQLDARGVGVESVVVRQATLDDVFLTLTGRTLRDDAA